MTRIEDRDLTGQRQCSYFSRGMKTKAEGERQPVKILSQCLALQLPSLKARLLHDKAQQPSTL